MDAWSRNIQDIMEPVKDIASELEAWFSVSGDMDDFIYYDEGAEAHSER